MRKKILAISFAAVFVAVFISFKIYGQGDIITAAQIQSPNTQANRQAIAQNVLENTGRQDQFTPEEAQDIVLYRGNATGDSRNEVIVAVQFTPKNTLVAVYEPVDNGVKYVAEIGEFFEVENIQFFPIEGLENDIVVIREEANQNIGAFEDSSFIRGYLWNGEKFDLVLSIPERIEASWNTRWDQQDDTHPWKRITQTTDIRYSDGGQPSIEAAHNQEYQQSSVTESKNIPDDSTFSKISGRTVTEKFNWSSKWRRFILSEKTENTTGKNVAVIEDFASSPYALLPDFGDNVNKVRIIREDGTTDIVFKNQLSDI